MSVGGDPAPFGTGVLDRTAQHLEGRVASVLRHAALAIMASLVIASVPTGGQLPATNIAGIARIGMGVIASRRFGNVSVTIVLAVSSYAALRAVGAA